MGALDMLLNDGNTTLVGVLVFLAAATLTFCIMAVVRVQGSVKRRAANIGRVGDIDRPGGNRSLRHSSLQGRAARASNTPPSIIRRATPTRPRCCAAG